MFQGGVSRTEAQQLGTVDSFIPITLPEHTKVVPFESTSPLGGILQVDQNIYNTCKNQLVPDSGKAYRVSSLLKGYGL
jgi:hypothetical protein